MAEIVVSPECLRGKEMLPISLVGRIWFPAGVGLRSRFLVSVAADVLSSERPQGASGAAQPRHLLLQPPEQEERNSSRMGTAVHVRGPVLVLVPPWWDMHSPAVFRHVSRWGYKGSR